MEVIPFGSTAAVTSNDNWGTSADLAEPNATRSAVGAFELATGSRDAAVLATLSTATNSAYTVRIAPSGTATDGIALAEVYDTEVLARSVRLGNVSTRGFVGTGGQVLTPGLVIGGDGAKLLLIRAIGPGLTPFGVTAVLADPQLAVIPAARNFPWRATTTGAARRRCGRRLREWARLRRLTARMPRWWCACRQAATRWLSRMPAAALAPRSSKCMTWILDRRHLRQGRSKAVEALPISAAENIDAITTRIGPLQ